jgi:YVTN family beta-propeller protein
MSSTATTVRTPSPTPETGGAARSTRRGRRLAVAVASALAAPLVLGIASAAAATPIYEVVDTIPVVGSSQIDVNPVTNTIYAANGFYRTLSVVDGATDTVTAAVPIDGMTQEVAANPATDMAYVAYQDYTDSSGRVAVVDGATNAVNTTIDTGGNSIGSLAVDSATNTTYALAGDFDPNTLEYVRSWVSVIDGSTNAATATIDLPGHMEDIAVNPVTGTVFLADFTNARLLVIDASTNQITGTIPIGGYPRSVTVNPATNTVYVATSSDIAVVDGATNTVTTTIPAPANTYYNGAVAVDASTNTVFARQDGNGQSSLVVIDAATNTVASTVSLGSDAVFSLAANPTTGRVYGGSRSNAITVFAPAGPTFTYSGVSQPINADGSSVFKAGSTVPVKFAVTDSDGASVADLTPTFSDAKLTDQVAGTTDETATDATATSGDTFRYDSTDEQYIYNWSTKGLDTGTYRLSIDLGDGQSHTVEVSLR